MEHKLEETKMETQFKKYQVRPGTIDSGKEYEYKMCALLSLRCVLHDVEDMWMASNAEGVGAFDDLILHVKMPGSNAVTYMLQLKHKDKATNILEKEFLSPSGNFSVSKYFKDIEKLQEALHCNSENQEIITNLGAFSDIYFILFTNRGTGDCEILARDVDETLRNFLNTGTSSANAYRFNLMETPNVDNVLLSANFYLLPSQVGAKNIDEQITAEIMEIAERLDLSNLRADRVSKDFTAYMTEWAKGNLGGHFYFTKEHLLCKLTELLLRQYMLNLRNEPFVDYGTDKILLWDQIVAHHSNIVIDADETVINFLLQHIRSEIQKYSVDSKICWDQPLREEVQQSFYEKQTHIRTLMLRRIGKHRKVTPFDIYICSWVSFKLPLLLKINSLDDYNNILKILKLSNDAFKIIVLKKDVELPPLQLEDAARLETLKHLDGESLIKILNQEVQIQGRPGAILRNLVNEDMLQDINGRDIIYILSGTFNIGQAFGKLPRCFIRRTLMKTVLQSQVLEEHHREIFLLYGNTEKLKYRATNIENLDFSNPESIPGIISAQGSINPEQLEILKLIPKPIHFLSVHNENCLEWIWSYGSTKAIDRFKIELEYQVEEHVTKTTIVSAAPGMGKSILMDFLAQKIPTNKWVLRIDLNRYQSYLMEPNCKTSTTQAQKHLQNLYHKNDTKIARSVFKNLVKYKNIVILIDGFDEISITCKNQAINLARSLHEEGYQIWLTTRPVMKFYLEDIFKTKSVTIKPFCFEDQKEFLVNYFTLEHADLSPSMKLRTMENFVNELLRATRKNINDVDDEFVGIPLLTKLLANVFSRTCREYLYNNDAITLRGNFDVLYLYQMFIDNKIKILLEKYGGAALDGHVKMKEQQSLFALKLVFPIDNSEWAIMETLYDTYTKEPEKCQLLQRMGLILVDDQFNISCIHKTIAEYLAAQWLADNINNPNLEIKGLAHVLIKERFTQNYNFLFNMFDRMLSKGFPLHLSVISKQVNKAEDIVDAYPGSVTETDRGGRLALHVAALYSAPLPMPYDQHLSQSNVNKDKTLHTIRKFLEKEKRYDQTDILGYSPLDYALGNRALAAANELSAKLEKPTIGVGINLDLKKYYLDCSYNYYTNLYEVLLPYFASRDLLLQNIHANAKIGEYTQYECKHKDRTILQLLQSEYGCCYTGFISKSFFNSYYTDLRYAIALGPKGKMQKVLNKTVHLNKQDVDGYTALHYAVLHNKSEIVKMLLDRGAEINRQNNDKNTPLHLAAKDLQIEIIKLLLDKGAKVNTTNKMGDTVLHVAIQKYDVGILDKLQFKDFTKIIDLLLSKGLDINADNKEGKTALHFAVIKKHPHTGIINCLLNNGADVNRETYNHQTPLHLAMEIGDLQAIKLLLKKAHIEAKDGVGNTPLHLACTHELPNSAKLLIKQGALVNSKNKFDNTPLQVALLNGYTSTAGILVANDAIVNGRNKDGNSPLHLALRAGLQDSVRLLVHEGADANVQNKNGDTPLHVALLKGCVSIGELLITQGVNINVKNNAGNSPLHLASIGGLENLVMLLLNERSNINEKNKEGNTSLHLALIKGYTSIAELLITKGAHTDVINEDGNSPLHLASIRNRGDIIQLLIHKNINTKNRDGDTPLHLALLKGHTLIAELLINENADVSITNAFGNTPLHVALLKGQVFLAELLVTKRAQIDTKNLEGNTPLHLASMRLPFVKLMQLLLISGADINSKNKHGDTPVHLAASRGREDALKVLLLKEEVNIDCQNQDGDTPLHVALLKGHLSVVKLLTNGSNINTRNKDGNTPLHLASIACSVQATRLLLLKGADINIRNEDGNTPLHLASDSVDGNTVELLLSEQANVNVENKDGDTPLHLACLIGCENTVKLLINEEANVNVRNKDGNTPLHMASKIGWKRTVKLLLSKEANINIVNNDGDTPLHLALLKEYTGVLELLIASGSHIHLANNDGNTPLHLASMKYYTSTPAVLLTKGANINAKNKDGDTPLHLAFRMGWPDTVKLLVNEGANIREKNKDGNTALDLTVIEDYCGRTAVGSKLGLK